MAEFYFYYYSLAVFFEFLFMSILDEIKSCVKVQVKLP